MEDIKQIFAQNLNRLMEQKGENLTQLSDAIDVAFSTVSTWALHKAHNRYYINVYNT